ncbi:MAG: NFACT RNA binding domain-containing protein [Pseudomonadota bacterium]|nr:NFACT RNA binding domain-containing protein [Pseudomonadota bacterium]
MKPVKSPPHHPMPPKLYHYELEDGWEVLAGRTDTDNDRLSLKTAHPDDRWFHVRGMAGSHVLLRRQKGMDPDRQILKQAAAIAAYHSKARSGGTVAVSCTKARYVSKPRGAKPGTVAIRKEITLKVKPSLPDELKS